ncbi:MAG: hypothetical protein E5W65_24400 [Mesorhizobium sp.]|uniref:hypothetical protein n=1 Tax=Mesorhizobium sp. TaxID=1871066 RepID=UPI001208F2B3|nr:hypothetical protein [Mesorhizobium sp.]TIT32635.1 MAG: hypothetical protein E5W65_24400 [Mesorhizobium sp.]
MTMYSPDQADIDPRNPANWNDPQYRYNVNARLMSGRVIGLDQFDDKDLAIAAVLNLETYEGIEVFIREVDLETGDDTTVLSAEWDEEILGGRYVHTETLA